MVHCKFLSIFDEGEYVESHDPKRLQKNLEDRFALFEKSLKEDTHCEGSIHLENRRIVDFVS